MCCVKHYSTRFACLKHQNLDFSLGASLLYGRFIYMSLYQHNIIIIIIIL